MLKPYAAPREKVDDGKTAGTYPETSRPRSFLTSVSPGFADFTETKS